MPTKHTPSNCPYRNKDEYTFGCTACMPTTTQPTPEVEEIVESFDKNFVIETIRQFGSQPQKVIYARKDKDIKDWLQEKFTQYGNQRAEAERQRIMKGVDKLYKDSKTGEILADSVLNIIQEPYAQQNK